MKIHNVRQGTAEWLALRRDFFTASEAPIMMGVSPYMTRDELLLLKATGLAPKETTDAELALFDKGHKAEAAARIILEEREECDFYPVVASDENMLASVDGATLLRETLFEHKLWNAALVAQIEAGELGPEYYWQLEQQLMIFDAERVIFVCSDGTADNWREMEYRPRPGRADELCRGWLQFEKDLANVGAKPVQGEIIGHAPGELPALRIELDGAVRASNLAEFKASAMAVIHNINTTLTTDQEFADAEKTVKYLAEVQTRLKAAKEHALAQMAGVYEVLTTLDSIDASARETRLILEKAIKLCKKTIRDNIVLKAQQELRDHIDAINEGLGGKVILPAIRGDFAEATSNKRTPETLQAAADTELRRVKALATETGGRMLENLNTLRELAADHAFLFSDAQVLALKDNDDLKAIIRQRVADYKERAEKQPPAYAPAPMPETAQEPATLACCTVVIQGLSYLAIGSEVRGGRVRYCTTGDWSQEVQKAINAELTR